MHGRQMQTITGRENTCQEKQVIISFMQSICLHIPLAADFALETELWQPLTDHVSGIIAPPYSTPLPPQLLTPRSQKERFTKDRTKQQSILRLRLSHICMQRNPATIMTHAENNSFFPPLFAKRPHLAEKKNVTQPNPPCMKALDCKLHVCLSPRYPRWTEQGRYLEAECVIGKKSFVKRVYTSSLYAHVIY